MATYAQTERPIVKVKTVSAEGYTQELRKMQWPPDSKEMEWPLVRGEFNWWPKNGEGLYYKFLKRMRILFDNDVPSEVKTQYIDDDGDWVTLDTDAELDVALLAQKVRPLVIIVYDKENELDDSARQRIMMDSGIPTKAVDVASTSTHASDYA